MIYLIGIKLVICAIFIVVFFLGGAYLIHNYATGGEDPASEYRALCIKKEGNPVFNGKYWECMK